MQESTLQILNSTTCNTPVSLHIPLHRTLSAILAKLALLPWKDTKSGFLSSLNLGYSEEEVCFKYLVPQSQNSFNFPISLICMDLEYMERLRV